MLTGLRLSALVEDVPLMKDKREKKERIKLLEKRVYVFASSHKKVFDRESPYCSC
jgi:hypothetical protein